MRPLAALLFALFALAVPAAYASDADLFTITGSDATSHPYTISFTLSPEDWWPSLGFDFVNVDVDINGTHRWLNMDFKSDSDTPPGYFDLMPTYPNTWQFFDIQPSDGVLPIENLYGLPYPPLFTLGTYAGDNGTACSAPAPASSLSGLPVISATCDSPITLTVTVPGGAGTATTPEPTPFVLLGTGLLGAAGAMRRRRSSAAEPPRASSLTYPAP